MHNVQQITRSSTHSRILYRIRKNNNCLLALRRDALNILHYFYQTEQKSYTALVDHHEMCYDYRRLFQAWFENKEQRPGELLLMDKAEVASLVRHAYPTALKDFFDPLRLQVFVDVA